MYCNVLGNKAVAIFRVRIFVWDGEGVGAMIKQPKEWGKSK
jgi:hypothetical protein